MLVLAFDASTADVAVAVARVEPSTGSDGSREVLAEISVPSRGASEALLPAADAALGLVGADSGDVDLILVGVGPGTFTGIRIAASVARSLAFSTGAALSTVSTLDALAAPARLSVGHDEPSVLAVLDARRRQVFVRRFGADGPVGGIACAYPNELPGAEVAEGEPLIVGDGAVRYRGTLSALGRIPPDASPLHRVTGASLVLAADLRPVPVEGVVPIYVREPDAEARRDLNPWSRS